MRRLLFILLIALVSFSISQAQDPNLPGGEVDIVKEFEARLGDAERFQLQPELPPLDTSVRRQRYNLLTNPIDVPYLAPRIRPLAYRTPPLAEVSHGYARLGGGFPSSLFADAGYDLVDGELLDVGIDAFHYSANNSNDLENQKMSNTHVGLYGDYYGDGGYLIDGNIGFSHDRYHFYGYHDLNSDFGTTFQFTDEEVRQQFNDLDIRLGIKNYEPTAADFDYSAELDMYFLTDNYAVRENGYLVKLAGTKWFEEQYALRVGLETDFTSYRDTAEQNLNNFFLQPSFTYYNDVFRARVGLNLASHDDEFFFFPDAEVSVRIIPTVLTVYAGAEGDLRKNTFHTLTDYNPFLSSRIQIENTNYLNFYGGAKGNLFNIEYDAQINYKDVDNLALFLVNTDSIPRFDVLYDTATVFTFKASVEVPIFEGFDLLGTISQSIFSLENAEDPWGLPSSRLTVGAQYAYDEKLVIRGNFFAENGIPYLADDGDAENLQPLYDLSFGAEYIFTRNIGAFLQVNNVLNNQRERWQRHPIFGINGLVGLSAKF